ncbi:MAG TPA: LysM peptidoglycan-binding domain-containing protein [Anaerolineales bacterium]|nr:LysM peptidoglycan-binding domain-containing protein [Anaerolineales bacterium]
MNVRSVFFLFLTITLLLLLGVALPFHGASAAPEAQFLTATPGPDGRIMYTVVEGDSCLQVALLHGITVPQLRQFNTRLDEDCTVTVGQQLVVGLAQAEAPTAGPAPTLPSPTVTPTPVSGTTEVCVLLFNDMNGDAVRQETEMGIEGGAVSLTNLNGSYSETQNTTAAVDPDTLEPVRACFIDVPNGEYNVSMAVPDDYNPTMLVSYTLTVKAGDRAEIGFGAQSKTITVSEPTDPQEGNRSSLLGIFGFLLLLTGAGLGYYAYRSGQPKSKLKGSPLSKR